MEHLFDGIEEIFSNKYVSQHSNKRVIISQIIINIIILSQQIQLFWYPAMQMNDWNKYQSFWNAISLFSLDIVAINIGFINEFIIFVIAFILVSSVYFALIIVLIYFKRKISAIYIYAIRLFLALISEVFFITYINILFAIIKYSFLQYTIVEEYSLSNQTVFDIGIAGGCAGIILLILINILAFVFNAGSWEIKQTADGIISTAKSNPRINQISTIVHFINSFMFFTIGYNYYRPYLLILLLLYGYIVASYVWNLPFYSYYLNLIKIFFHLECVLVIIVFLIGSQLNNASIPFLIILIMQVVLLILTDLLLKHRISKINTNLDLSFLKFEKYELLIRRFLKSGELKENLLVKLNENFKYNNNSLNRIVSAYYCNDILQDYKLAFNQIIGVKYEGINIFLNYQIYKCKKIMKNACKHLSEGHRIQKFFIDFEKIKIEDYHFCENYLKLSEEIISPLQNLSKLKQIINNLAKQKTSLVNLYNSALLEFPNSEEINDFYGSLLSDILDDADKGQIYLNRILKVNKPKGAFQNSECLNDQALVIFSGNSQNIGKILHVNSSFIDFINSSMDEIQMHSFFNFFPSLYSKKHEQMLVKFMENCIETVIYSSLPLFLLNDQGFLCECFISIETVGDNESIDFLCRVDPIYSLNRELAVIDIDGVISAHSKYFLKILGLNQNHGENMNIQYFLPDINIRELAIDTIYEYKLSKNNIQQDNKFIRVILKCYNIRDIIIHALFLSDSIDLVNNWNNLEEFYLNECNNCKDDALNKNKLEEDKENKKILITEDIKEKSKMADDNKSINLDVEKIKKNYSIQDSETIAVKKSIRALKVSKFLLFVSVTYN